MKRNKFIILIFLFLFVNTLVAQISEYEVKAVFLERFTRFIEWPEESEINDTIKPFVISVIGKNPFEGILEETYSTQKIMDKPVTIRFISKIEQIEDTDILFITESKGKQLLKIISYTKNKPILTVGDTKGFAKKGVIINFYLRNDNVRFEINKSAARESGSLVSSLLFNLARDIETKEEHQ